jgi:phosphoglycerol transferase MdoB-like AlkP superfamily enzyme
VISRFRTWLNKIPIEDPVNRQMAALLQVVLIGIIGIFTLSVAISTFLPSQSTPISALVIRLLITVFIFGIPLFLLRRGWYQTSVLIILALLTLFITYAVFNSRLRDIAETLTFFTLAILLAGLLVGRGALIIAFLISTAAVLIRAFQEQDAILRTDAITVALNFILLNCSFAKIMR